MQTVLIDKIQIGERVRKDMGDLKSLAESIARHGLLHPVVIKTDNTLIAGHRRIEAARLLSMKEIPVTVIDVDDLLGAERDENAERKNFTPTEAVTIGRMIETEQQIRLKATSHERQVAAGIKGAIKKGFVLTDGGGLTKRGNAIDTSLVFNQQPVDTRDSVSSAVGMSGTKYYKAKKVVEAAELDPDSFGDLPARMDETGNVNGALEELKRRQGKSTRNGKKPRHAVMRHMNYPKPNREVERAIHSLDGICDVLDAIEPEQLEEAKRRDWSIALKKIGARINLFSRRISYGN